MSKGSVYAKPINHGPVDLFAVGHTTALRVEVPQSSPDATSDFSSSSSSSSDDDSAHEGECAGVSPSSAAGSKATRSSKRGVAKKRNIAQIRDRKRPSKEEMLKTIGNGIGEDGTKVKVLNAEKEREREDEVENDVGKDGKALS